ncbi:MAG: SDR family oxidoreductase [Calditrichia bacterium]
MKKVLITGASGFLGGYLLKQAPPETSILAQGHTHPVTVSASNIRKIQLDLTKADWQLLLDFHPDVIVYTAAMASLAGCQQNPGRARQVNLEATQKLVEIARKNEARFIFTSTDIVFDGEKGNYSEKDPANPINVYGKTKAAAENHILQMYNNAVVIRTSLLYGISLGGQPTFTQKAIERLQKGERVNAFTDEIRNPLPVGMLAQAIWELVEHDFTGLLHIGGSEKISRYNMALKICRYFGLPQALINPVSSEKSGGYVPRPKNCSLNISLAQNVLKTILVDFETGLSLAF